MPTLFHRSSTYETHAGLRSGRAARVRKWREKAGRNTCQICLSPIRPKSKSRRCQPCAKLSDRRWRDYERTLPLQAQREGEEIKRYLHDYFAVYNKPQTKRDAEILKRKMRRQFPQIPEGDLNPTIALAAGGRLGRGGWFKQRRRHALAARKRRR